MRNVETRLQQAISDLSQTIHQSTNFESIHDASGIISELLDHLLAGCERANRPLRIVMTGGTGVGKSSILNAIAQQEIAPASPIRPTTKAFTVYTHELDEDPWIYTLSGAEIVRHDRPLLKGKCIIDAPDSDSAVTHHRDLLIKVLELADLAIVVVTSEKYVSQNILEILNDFRNKCQFAFLLNKIDLNPEKEVLADFKDLLARNGFGHYPVFSITTKTPDITSDSSMTNGKLRNELHQFSEYLERELDATRIREIKRLNLTGRLKQVIDYINGLLPGHFQNGVDDWQEACEDVIHRYASTWTQTIASKLLQINEIYPAFILYKMKGLRGLFGFIANLIYMTIHSIQWRSIDQIAEGDSNWIGSRINREDEVSIARDEKHLFSAYQAIGTRMGYKTEHFESQQAASAENSEPGSEWLISRLSRVLATRFRQHCRPAGVILSSVLNLPLLLWVGYWIYLMIKPVLHNDPVPWEALPGAVIVLAVLAAFEWALTNKIMRWWAHRKARSFISDSTTALHEILSERQKKIMNTSIEPYKKTSVTLAANLNYLENLLKNLVKNETKI